ncbi:MAG: gerPD [Paenibacillus sp.]|jgi:spore germination protein PD|nr:gerPD [Paenibacillus sp.]
MNMQVVNKGVQIGNIQVTGVSSSSIFLIGDTELVTLSSIFDTPPESLLIGPLVPLAPER